uniref:Ig-like domain-containing protein n=1 Tax=Poecilia mexicana TaxID=48701 RepID=A0A3B3YE86_9TELE
MTFGRKCLILCAWRELSSFVSNRFGQSTCSSYLHVQLKEPEGEKRVDDKAAAATGQPPKFMKAIESVQLSEGGQCFFRYVLTGEPLPDVQWFKGSIHIDRFTASSLEILSPSKDDSGEYTCKASNQHGSDECSASLSVTGKNNACFLLFWFLTLAKQICFCTFILFPPSWFSWFYYTV